MIKTKLDFIKDLRNSKNVAEEESEQAFYCNVLIKDKKMRIYCGAGKQKLRWLTDAAIFKYRAYSEQKCGVACFVKLEDGSICELEEQINQTLQNNENIWVLFKEEYEVYVEELNKKYLPYVPGVSSKTIRKVDTKLPTSKDLKKLNL